MIIIYPKHAMERMKQRNISKEIVEMLFANQEKIEHKVNESVLIKKLKTKLLVVVFRETDGVIFVITAYITSKVNKYFD
jgi:hypothetical protein